MQKSNRLFGLALSGVLLIPVHLSHGQFFEKNYAQAPAVGGQPSRSSSIIGGSPLGNQEGNRPAVGAAGRPVTPPAVNIDEVNGVPMLELGLVVNSSEAKERLAQLDEVLTRLGSKVRAGPLLVRGENTRQFSAGSPLLLKLRARGLRVLEQQDSIGAGLVVSPSWLVGTASGYQVLEGLDDLSGVINSRGEFVAPGSVEPTPTPIPEVAPERF